MVEIEEGEEWRELYYKHVNVIERFCIIVMPKAYVHYLIVDIMSMKHINDVLCIGTHE